MKYLAYLSIIIITIFIISSYRCVKYLDWQKLAEVPYFDKKIKPQGMVFINSEKLLLSMHHNDTKSTIHLVDVNSKKEIKCFTMPGEATHTSGLTLKDNDLIALDYNSNKLYIIDLNASLKVAEAVVKYSIPTNLNGSSSCCYLEYGGNKYLIVSDFMRTKKTYVLNFNTLAKLKNFEKAIITSYRNKGMSQGLVYKKGYVFESNNSIWGYSLLDVIAFESIINNVKLDRVCFRTSILGIEDLDFQNDFLWTTDEKKLFYFKTKIDFNSLSNYVIGESDDK